MSDRPLSNGSFDLSPDLVIRPPVVSATEGVAQSGVFISASACCSIAGGLLCPPWANGRIAFSDFRWTCVGVAHNTIASLSVTPSWCWLFAFDRPDVRFLAPLLSVTAAVGHDAGHAEDEYAFALMACANFRRLEESDLNRETKLAKVSPNPLGSSDFISPRREHAADVFDDGEPGAGLDDDSASRGPKVACVVASLLSSSQTMRLARNAANDAIHKATPWAAAEGSGIAPNRGLSQETLLHR